MKPRHSFLKGYQKDEWYKKHEKKLKPSRRNFFWKNEINNSEKKKVQKESDDVAKSIVATMPALKKDEEEVKEKTGFNMLAQTEY